METSGSIRRWVFARHAHPVSAWSRWASTPLVVVPLWSRRAWTALPIGAWMIINPICTPPVTDDRAFATRAILGEERWIADPARNPDIVALNVVATACLVAAGIAARGRRLLPTALAIGAAMAVVLITWRSYAALYDSVTADADPFDPADPADPAR